MANRSPKEKKILKEWLEQLQQESWQLELLISGLALFGIIESRSYFQEVLLFVDDHYTGVFKSAAAVLGSTFHIGWSIFFINLLVHVIFRGLWIGAIGLRYVSHEIEYDQLNYSKRFTNLLKKRVGEFDDYIEKLERFCSVIFAYTFLLFLFFFSASMFIFWFIIIENVIDQILGETITVFFILLYLGLGVIVFIDFITLGLLKKIENNAFSRSYSYIYNFYSYITLSFLYTPLLYNFLDNKYTRRLFFMSIPYILVIIFHNKTFEVENFEFHPPTSVSNNLGMTVQNSNYDDLRNQYFNEGRNSNRKRYGLPLATINEFELSSPYLKIFLKTQPFDGKSIEHLTDYTPYYEKGLSFTLFKNNLKNDEKIDSILAPIQNELSLLRSERRPLIKKLKNTKNKDYQRLQSSNDSLTNLIDILIEKRDKTEQNYEERKLESIKNAFISLHKIELNNIDISNDLDCFYYIHPNAEEKGLLCLYPADSIATGKNILSVDKYRYKNGKIEDYKTNSIPFLRVIR